MTVHIIKLCVGAESLEDLATWQAARLARLKRDGEEPKLKHMTLQMPKRASEVLDGGSLYWVIKGLITARQVISDLQVATREDGVQACNIVLEPGLTIVQPTPRRPFQGWRYLSIDDAPADLSGGDGRAQAALPLKMRRELAELGLL